MPNMLDDGFLDQAFFMRLVSNTPSNLNYQLDNAVSSAIGTAALQGLFTTTVNMSAYSANSYALVQWYMTRLTNMGYTSSLNSSTLTINWSVQ